MRTVKLTIEVEVPDDAGWVTVDEDGTVLCHKDDDDIRILYDYERRLEWNSDGVLPGKVVNCEKLKINLKEYFSKQYRVIPPGRPVESSELPAVEEALGIKSKNSALPSASSSSEE